MPIVPDDGPIPAIVRTVTAAFLATGVLAGCSQQSDQHVNCVDQNGNIVDPDYCDRDGGGGGNGFLYWYLLSNRSYPIGSRAPSNWTTTRIDPHNAQARADAHLPKTGKLGGTTIRGGGFGRGSSGSHGDAGSHGGSGAHGSGGGHSGGG